MQLHAEAYSVFKFLKPVDRVDLNLPDYSKKSVHNELLEKAFNDLVMNIRFFSNESMFGLFAMAQHHGVPTRLLDWSESAFVAAFSPQYLT